MMTLEDLFPVKHNPLFSAVFVFQLGHSPAEHSNSFCASKPFISSGISVDENARHAVEERHSLLDKALETGRLRVSGQGDVGPHFRVELLGGSCFGQDRAARCLSASSSVHTDDDGDASLHGSVWATSHSVLGQAPGTHLGCMLHGTLSATDSHELNIASLHGILDASIPRLPALSIETQVSRMPPTGTLPVRLGRVDIVIQLFGMMYRHLQCGVSITKLSWTCKAAHGRKHAAVYTRDHMSPDDSPEGVERF
eukprot:jgi/Picre1/34810/NNA_002276.t1